MKKPSRPDGLHYYLFHIAHNDDAFKRFTRKKHFPQAGEAQQAKRRSAQCHFEDEERNAYASTLSKCRMLRRGG